MRINNPLQMNDWPIKRFLAAVLAIQLMLWFVIGLGSIGLEIPLLKPLLGLIYLALMPGIVILRILKLHKLGNIETLLYSIGLSLAFLMFAGALINAILPFFGIPRPITLISLMISFTTFIWALSILAYVRDKNFLVSAYVDVRRLPSRPIMFLLLIPLLSVLGTQLLNSYQTNILLMLLITVIAFTVLLIGLNKFIPRNQYPFAVFSIALSLLFYRSLISVYISGSDIHEEYYIANLVEITGRWDSASPLILVNMLSITMLAPIISILCGLSLTWVLKVAYPLLFSLVPVVLYQIFRKQTNKRISFLSCLFFMAVSYFFTGMPVVARQQIATLFLTLLVLLMLDKQMDGTKRSVLFIIFGASLVVSHYGLAYIYMFYLIGAWLILILLNSPEMRKLIDRLYSKFGIINEEEHFGGLFSNQASTISFTFIALFIVLALTWYMNSSSGTVFERYVYIFQNITTNFIASFLNSEASQGLTLLLRTPKAGVLHTVNAIINYLNQIFIVVGVVVLFLKHKKLKFHKEYVVFSILSLIIIFAGLIVPFLTMRVDMQRLYHIALIFLAPMGVIGSISAFIFLGQRVKRAWGRQRRTQWIKVSAVSMVFLYFMIFFLYETGVIWQVTELYFGSISLSQETIKRFGNPITKGYFYSSVTPEQDVLGAKWLSSANTILGKKVYATYSDAQVHPLTSYGMILSTDVTPLTRATKTIPEDAYVYLQYLNVVERIGTEFNTKLLPGTELITYDMAEVSYLLAGRNKIYSNAGSEIYR